MEGSSLSPVSCRMARASVDWSQERLAAEAHVSRGVINLFEKGVSTPRRNNLAEIVLAFERAGVEFLVHGARILVLPPLATRCPDGDRRGLEPRREAERRPLTSDHGALLSTLAQGAQPGISTRLPEPLCRAAFETATPGHCRIIFHGAVLLKLAHAGDGAPITPGASTKFPAPLNFAVFETALLGHKRVIPAPALS
jgi:transcriptional regulator with XRE-family HTH domain